MVESDQQFSDVTLVVGDEARTSAYLANLPAFIHPSPISHANHRPYLQNEGINILLAASIFQRSPPPFPKSCARHLSRMLSRVCLPQAQRHKAPCSFGLMYVSFLCFRSIVDATKPPDCRSTMQLGHLEALSRAAELSRGVRGDWKLYLRHNCYRKLGEQ